MLHLKENEKKKKKKEKKKKKSYVRHFYEPTPGDIDCFLNLKHTKVTITKQERSGFAIYMLHLK